jgi:hypothetical protein
MGKWNEMHRLPLQLMATQPFVLVYWILIVVLLNIADIVVHGGRSLAADR